MLAMLENVFSQVAVLAGQFVVFVILNILDGHSTWKVIQPNHLHRERNPVARWIFLQTWPAPGDSDFQGRAPLILGGAFAVYAKKETKMMNITSAWPTWSSWPW